MKNKELNESLQRYRELLGYNPEKGGSSLNEYRRRHSYPADDTDYAEGDEEETEETDDETQDEGGDNPDFDFGGEEGSDETEGQETEGGFGDEGEEETEEETDEFGTADEFSAADELEDEDSDVEEIDVTDIVKKSEDAKSYSEKAVKAAEEGKSMITDLMSKFDALQNSLSKIDTVANELNVIKKDIQSQKPKEKLELRSLDSYPFNVKLTDYWNDEKLKDNYEINGGKPDGQSEDGQVKVWKLDPNDAKDFSNVDIKKSFVPESKAKKKVLTEDASELLELAPKFIAYIVGLKFLLFGTILALSPKHRILFKNLFKGVPKLMSIRKKIKNSEKFSDLKNETENLTKNPSEAGVKNIMSKLNNVLNSEEISELNNVLKEINKEVKNDLDKLKKNK